MNNEDIIRIAKEAWCGWTANGTEPMLLGERQIKRFAALVAAHEREACAELAGPHLGGAIAAAIRARGET